MFAHPCGDKGSDILRLQQDACIQLSYRHLRNFARAPGCGCKKPTAISNTETICPSFSVPNVTRTSAQVTETELDFLVSAPAARLRHSKIFAQNGCSCFHIRCLKIYDFPEAFEIGVNQCESDVGAIVKTEDALCFQMFRSLACLDFANLSSFSLDSMDSVLSFTHTQTPRQSYLCQFSCTLHLDILKSSDTFARRLWINDGSMDAGFPWFFSLLDEPLAGWSCQSSRWRNKQRHPHQMLALEHYSVGTVI